MPILVGDLIVSAAAILQTVLVVSQEALFVVGVVMLETLKAIAILVLSQAQLQSKIEHSV